jgi:hypothetical protein
MIVLPHTFNGMLNDYIHLMELSMYALFMNQALPTVSGMFKCVFLFVYTLYFFRIIITIITISLLFLLEETYWPTSFMQTRRNYLLLEQMWDILSMPASEISMLISVILMVSVAESLWAGYQL